VRPRTDAERARGETGLLAWTILWSIDVHTKDDRARCARYAFLAIFIYTFAAGLAIGLL